MIIFKESTVYRPELIGKIKTKMYLGIKTSYQLETSTFNIINRQINTKFFTLLAIWCYFDHICWGRNDVFKVIWNFYKEVPIDKRSWLMTSFIRYWWRKKNYYTFALPVHGLLFKRGALPRPYFRMEWVCFTNANNTFLLNKVHRKKGLNKFAL